MTTLTEIPNCSSSYTINDLQLSYVFNDLIPSKFSKKFNYLNIKTNNQKLKQPKLCFK